MVKLILGVKGTGKTKTLIEMVNAALNKSSGSVVCIEKGAKLTYDIKYQARLIEADAYFVDDAQSLFGFVAGISASDHDLTDLFIDSALRICGDDLEAFEKMVDEMNKLSEKVGFNCIMTSSIPLEETPETLKKYL